MNIKKELTKGSSAMLVLSVLEKEELYGYMIIKRISERSDNTFNFKEGTLYPILHNFEANGYVNHKAYGNSYQYFPVISREEYAGSSFKGIISNYFNNSYLNAVSALVKEEKISIEELKELIKQIENGKN